MTRKQTLREAQPSRRVWLSGCDVQVVADGLAAVGFITLAQRSDHLAQRFGSGRFGAGALPGGVGAQRRGQFAEADTAAAVSIEVTEQRAGVRRTGAGTGGRARGAVCAATGAGRVQRAGQFAGADAAIAVGIQLAEQLGTGVLLSGWWRGLQAGGQLVKADSPILVGVQRRKYF